MCWVAEALRITTNGRKARFGKVQIEGFFMNSNKVLSIRTSAPHVINGHMLRDLTPSREGRSKINEVRKYTTRLLKGVWRRTKQQRVGGISEFRNTNRRRCWCCILASRSMARADRRPAQAVMVWCGYSCGYGTAAALLPIWLRLWLLL